jgi:hypothetical protein
MLKHLRQLEQLLHQEQFKLVSQKKHLKYKNPQGKIFIVSKTPSDVFAMKNALGDLKRIVAAPPPSNEFVEEQRQRNSLEATIRLESKQKRTTGGGGVAGKNKKSRGVGISYFLPKSPFPVAEPLSEEQERERRAKEEIRLALAKERNKTREEWGKVHHRLRNEYREMMHDFKDIHEFAIRWLCIAALRHAFLRELSRNKYIWQNKSVRRDLLHLGIDEWLIELEHPPWAVEMADRPEWLAVQVYLFEAAKRGRSWAPPIDEFEINIDAKSIRILRFVLGRLDKVKGFAPPEWLETALRGLRPGKNVISHPGGRHVAPMMWTIEEKERAAAQ